MHKEKFASIEHWLEVQKEDYHYVVAVVITNQMIDVVFFYNGAVACFVHNCIPDNATHINWFTWEMAEYKDAVSFSAIIEEATELVYRLNEKMNHWILTDAEQNGVYNYKHREKSTV